MTKEKLEEYENKIVMQEKSKLQEEAENYLNQNRKRWKSDSLCVGDIAIENYLASAEPREKRIAELEAQIEKIKSDVKTNIKWADQNKNDQMWQKLVKMYSQWS